MIGTNTTAAGIDSFIHSIIRFLQNHCL